jgi:phosphoribosylanthranilate isomerase
VAERFEIKICGISNAETARAVVDSGATAIGFMLAPSRRQVTLATIRAIREQLSSPGLSAVAVVVNQTADQVQALLDGGLVDAVQLSGDEPPDILDQVSGTIWKALRFPAGTTFDPAEREVSRWLDRSRPADRLMIDGSVDGAYGGTGHTADWDLIARISERYPVILAGGLTPANVETAIAQVRPTGVDVSSGVETDGGKDPDKISAFVAAARSAFSRL